MDFTGKVVVVTCGISLPKFIPIVVIEEYRGVTGGCKNTKQGIDK
jgi:hypothetical protein